MPIRRPVRLLATTAFLLVVAHVLALVARQVWGVDPRLGIVRQVDLNGEGNVAAWFASFLLTSCAGLALVVAVIHRLRHDRLAGRWTALSAFFLVMAVDETAQLHDMATGPIRNGLGLEFGALYFAWLIPALLVLALAAVYFAPLVGSLSAKVRPQLIIAAAVYFGGAVGCEMISGSAVEEGRKSLTYLSVMTLEEALELTGALLLLNALLVLVHELRPHLTVSWVDDEPRVSQADAAVPAVHREP